MMMKSRTSILIAIAIVGSLLAEPGHAARKKRVVLSPKQAGQGIAIVVGEKTRVYHPLSLEKPSVVEVKGPGDLRILTRARFDARTTGDLAYRLLYTIDGAEQHAVDIEGVERAPDARYKDIPSATPGDAEELTLSIGRGQHAVEVRLRDSVPNVAARFLFTPRKQKKTKWVALCPLPPLEPVDLYAGEETMHCYRFSAEKPLKVEIIGPTELRIVTRVENSFAMKGRANYRIQVRHNGEVMQSFQLSSKRSETAAYKSNPKLVPGKAREIVFTVPKGKQRYEIAPLDRHTILGQVLFPQKDAKLGL